MRFPLMILLAAAGVAMAMPARAGVFAGMPDTPECEALFACFCDAEAGACAPDCTATLCSTLDGNASLECKVCGAVSCTDELAACDASGNPEPPFSCATLFPGAPSCGDDFAPAPSCDEAITSGCIADGDLICAEGWSWGSCCTVGDALEDVCIADPPTGG